ncbi:HIT domain-containing protein [Plantibacter flavus]|uniref:HIT family protein n=1 Tax=Plantibacter flavus TaxID=150123 RepID=UPI003F169F1A
MSEPCTFCRIITEESDDTVWVEREAEAVAFRPLPASELAPGHTLVVPRAHSVGLLDTDPRSLQATIALAQRVGRAMKAALDATGVVVLSASGVDAGQSVPHLHLHVVPCWDDDGVTFWPEGVSAHRVEGDPHALLAEMFE